MPPSVERHRAYLLISADGPAHADTVAELFERAAADIRRIGLVTVQGVTYDQDAAASSPSCSLTVYYDRIERRRTSRTT